MNKLTYFFFSCIFMFTHVLTSMAGLFFADRFNAGETGFDWERDAKRMTAVSLLSLFAPMAILAFVRTPWVVILYIFLFFLFARIFYENEINVPELGIVVMTNLLGMVIFRFIVGSRFVLLIHIFFLTCMLWIYFYMMNKKKRLDKERSQYSLNREREIRDLVQRHPDWQTFCYECMHAEGASSECSLDSGDFKKRITILVGGQGRSYCLYWQERPGNKRGQPDPRDV